MSNRPKALNSSKKLGLNLQPAPAWTAILGFTVVVALCLLVGAGRILNPIFLLGSFGVGVFLYWRYPILYVGFTWWMFFLTSLIRRIIDYQSGAVNAGSWMLAAMLVATISSITLVRYLPRSYKYGGLPFILCFTSVIYSLLIGLVQNAISLKFITIFLDWATPIIFGFHLFANWQDYPSYRQNIQRTFLWGVLVMGVYGVWQYLVAPEWDVFYIHELEVPSFGIPEPLGIRVFSTIGSPQAFAAVMMAGLLLLFINSAKLRFPIAGIGYLTFLLSLARSAWISWGVALLIFFGSARARLQMRLIISIVIAIVFVMPLTTMEPFSTAIGERLQTLSDSQSDISYQERTEGFNELIGKALAQVLGGGMLTSIGNISGFVIGDNGFLVMLFTLGWVGTLPYLVGLLLLFFTLFQSPAGRLDPFANVARAIALGSFSQIGLKTVITGEMGMILWGFLGIALAAHKYYRHQLHGSMLPNRE